MLDTHQTNNKTLSNMKKIIKIAEAKKIAKANEMLGDELDDLLWGIDQLNKGELAKAVFTKKELIAVTLFLISREVRNDRQSDFTSNARELCVRVDNMLLMPIGYSLRIAQGETCKCNRIMVAECNMGLNHITLTNCNPY